jgi:hypothetical protein
LHRLRRQRRAGLCAAPEHYRPRQGSLSVAGKSGSRRGHAPHRSRGWVGHLHAAAYAAVRCAASSSDPIRHRLQIIATPGHILESSVTADLAEMLHLLPRRPGVVIVEDVVWPKTPIKPRSATGSTDENHRGATAAGMSRLGTQQPRLRFQFRWGFHVKPMSRQGTLRSSEAMNAATAPPSPSVTHCRPEDPDAVSPVLLSRGLWVQRGVFRVAAIRAPHDPAHPGFALCEDPAGVN